MFKPVINQNWILLIARLLFSSAFIFSAIDNLVYFNTAMNDLISAGIHTYVKELLIISIIAELGGSLMVLFGCYARIGALILFVFTVVAAFMIHHFWTYPSAEIHLHLALFFLDMTILGGALYIINFGSGAYSLTTRQEQA